MGIKPTARDRIRTEISEIVSIRAEPIPEIGRQNNPRINEPTSSARGRLFRAMIKITARATTKPIPLIISSSPYVISSRDQ